MTTVFSIVIMSALEFMEFMEPSCLFYTSYEMTVYVRSAINM